MSILRNLSFIVYDKVFKSIPTSDNFRHLLITFVHSLDPDQDPNCLTFIVFLEEFFEKVIFEKSADYNKVWKITQHSELK